MYHKLPFSQIPNLFCTVHFELSLNLSSHQPSHQHGRFQCFQTLEQHEKSRQLLECETKSYFLAQLLHLLHELILQYLLLEDTQVAQKEASKRHKEIRSVYQEQRTYNDIRFYLTLGRREIQMQSRMNCAKRFCYKYL